ncbi:hypothetical protein ACHQM5_027411 [Ranunculus cassubicifolius]
MIFRKGNAVEVLRRREQYEGWFPGVIVSADRYKSTVRYDLFRNCEGDSVVEDVCNQNIRPNPPSGKEGERWMAGRAAEVLDLHCWRVGKVVKVLNNNRFVIRLSGSIQLKEFQRADLRVMQAWRSNKWFMIEKAGEQTNVKLNSSKYSHDLNLKESCTEENARQENLGTFHPMRSLKRKQEYDYEIPGKRTSTKAGHGPPLQRQVDVISSPKKNMGKKCMIKSTKLDVETYNIHPYSMPEESIECSVASCSSNGPLVNPRKSKSIAISRSSFDDAESMCFPTYDRFDVEDDVHKLELHAYRLTMKALYASGPLSWEQESLLTNLRLSLNISNEEHLVNLRQLMSAQ